MVKKQIKKILSHLVLSEGKLYIDGKLFMENVFEVDCWINNKHRINIGVKDKNYKNNKK